VSPPRRGRPVRRGAPARDGDPWWSGAPEGDQGPRGARAARIAGDPHARRRERHLGQPGGWSWSFRPSDPSAAIAAYRSWFMAGGYDLLPPGTDGIGSNDLVLVSYEAVVRLPSDGTIEGTVGDIAIGRDGELRHLPPP